MTTTAPSYVALLGGSFNPPHIGHFRMALEVYEAFAPQRLLFIPCASPPHKTGRNLLPFDLRVHMLESMLQESSHHCAMQVCTMEKDRPGPSYTVDTLTALTKTQPGTRLLFILGCEDFALLPTWSRWQQIPALADMVVLPRTDNTQAGFIQTVHTLWPDAVQEIPHTAELSDNNGKASLPSTPIHKAPATPTSLFSLPQGGKIFFLPQPRLEISSSLVRARWLAGRSLDFIVPKSIVALLTEHKKDVASLWNQSPQAQ